MNEEEENQLKGEDIFSHTTVAERDEIFSEFEDITRDLLRDIDPLDWE